MERGNFGSKLGIVKGIVTATIILGFYAVVAGWCLQYLFASVLGHVNGDAEYVKNYFVSFSSDPLRPVLWGVGFVLITHLVVLCSPASLLAGMCRARWYMKSLPMAEPLVNESSESLSLLCAMSAQCA